jgi:MFS transporter, ACS family, glucarate transporter
VTGAPKSNVRWFLVFWLFILSAVSYLDRVNVSIAGSSLAREYHLGDVQLGWIFSAFLVGYAVSQTPAGWLADRFGPRRVLTAGVFWWGIFTALTAAVPIAAAKPILFFIAIRFLLGAGEALVYPSSNQFIARWIPTQERGIANGWIFAGVGAGAGFAPPLITYVMIHHGWRSSFWVCAGIGFAAGIVWYLAARDKPEQHTRVSTAELAKIRAGLTLRGAEPEVRGGKAVVPWAKILGGKVVWVLTGSYFCYCYIAWIFFGWFYIYLARVRGLNLKASAFYAMLPFLAMAACCMLGGLLSDWLTRHAGKRLGRCGVAIFGICLAGIFLAFGAKVDSARLASVVLAGGAGALYLSQSSFWSVTADIGGAFSGSVSGFMNMGGMMGGAVSTSLTPWIAKGYGWTASFLVAAGLCAVGALAWIFVNPERSLIAKSDAARSLSDDRNPEVWKT